VTLITGTITDIGMRPIHGVLDAQPAEFRADGGVIYSTNVSRSRIKFGVVEATVAPGPVRLTIRAGKDHRKVLDVVVPDQAEISLGELLDSVFPWEPPQVAEFTRLRDETVEAARLAQELLDGYVGGGEGTTDAALLHGSLSDRVDASAATVVVGEVTRSVADIAAEVDQKAPAGHGHPIGHVGGLSDALAAKADVGHGHEWDVIADKPEVFPPSAHTHDMGDVSGLGAALDGKAGAGHGHSVADVGGLSTALSGKADLGADGRLSPSQLPDLAIVEFLGEVADSAGMLALTGERGDWCVRSDLGTQWVIVDEPSSASGSWREMVAPPSPVQSVAGRIGAVVLGKADVGLSSVDDTSDADKPVSTAVATALAGKAAASHTHVVSEVDGLSAALAGKADTSHSHTAAQVGAIASDGTITKAVRITQAAYDALPVRDPFTLYVIGGA
jgi:hypothetical protein